MFRVVAGMAVGTTAAWGGGIHFQSLTLSDGLSNSYVTSIIQTKDGYLWIGTKDGLNRFDGYEVKVFRPEGVGSYFVKCLAEDDEGVLWIGAEGRGLDRFDPAEGKIERYLERDSVASVHWEKGRGLWLSGDMEGGLDFLEKGSQKPAHFPVALEAYGGVRVRKISEKGRDERFWIETEMGLLEFDRLERRWHLPLENLKPVGYTLQSAMYDVSGSLYAVGKIDSTNYVLKWNDTESPFDTYPIKSEEKEVIPTNGESIVMASRSVDELFVGGRILMVINPQNHSVEVYPHEPERISTIAHSEVTCLYKGEGGRLWIGTPGGVSWVEAPVPWLQKISPRKSAARSEVSLSASRVWQREDGLILASRREGVDVFDKKTADWRMLPIKNARGEFVPINSAVMVEDEILAATTEGVFRQSLDGGDRKQILDRGANVLAEESGGGVWIGTDAGLWQWKAGGGDMIAIAITNIPETRILSMDLDPEGGVWMGTETYGLLHWRPDTQTWNSYPVENAIEAVCAASATQVWIGTNRGLARFDLRSQAAKYLDTFGRKIGAVKGIDQDEDGRLWLASEGGLGWVAPKGENPDLIHIIPPADIVEIPSHVYSVNAAKGGTVLCASEGGIYTVNTKLADWTDGENNVVAITKVRTLGKGDQIIDSPQIPLTGMTLKHSDKLIDLHFSALKYAFVRNAEYAFRLDGFDDDWRYSGEVNQAMYTNLDPGNYKFRVMVVNTMGVWQESAQSLAFTVLPDWWETSWFMTGAVIAFLLGIYGIYRIRTREIVSSNSSMREEIVLRTSAEESLKTEVDQRTQAEMRVLHLAGRLIDAQELEFKSLARDIHDDLSQQLAAISMEMAQDGNREKVQQKMEQIVASVQDLGRRLHPSVLKDLGLVKGIRSLCRRMGQHSGINIELACDEALPLTTSGANLCLYRILQEGLHNVVKHAQATSVQVSLQVDGTDVVLQIHDNGQGFVNESEVTHGLGLVSMEERAKLMGGSLSINSQKGIGTIVEARIPAESESKRL
jgi:signal transduction histidine kinase/ligand-binding sensor domain-containing protein